VSAWAVAGAALGLGFLGSAHCAAMCGPIACVSAARGERRGAGERLAASAPAHLGRLTTYAALGAAAGFAGSLAPDVGSLAAAGRAVGALAGLVLVWAGLATLVGARMGSPIERAGRGVFARVLAFARAMLARGGARAAYAFGLAWGLLPCGLVYAGALVAASSRSAPGGALAMAAFGLGTLPALGLATLTAHAARGWLQKPGLRVAAGALLVVMGTEKLVASAQPEVRPCCAAREG
jgi:sulfite exporter TauE/SafE